MPDLIPDEVLKQTADPTAGVVNLQGQVWKDRLILDLPATGIQLDTEEGGYEDYLFTTADLARQLLEAREALRANMADAHLVGGRDRIYTRSRACLPEHQGA